MKTVTPSMFYKFCFDIYNHGPTVLLKNSESRRYNYRVSVHYGELQNNADFEHSAVMSLFSVKGAEVIVQLLNEMLAHSKTDIYHWARRKVGKE